MTSSKIQMVFGLWLILSPWLLGFADVSLAKWNAVLLGITLTLMNAWQVFGIKDKNSAEKNDF